MKKPQPIEVGATYEVGHPFIRYTYTDIEGEASTSWLPGVRMEPKYPDHQTAVAGLA